MLSLLVSSPLFYLFLLFITIYNFRKQLFLKKLLLLISVFYIIFFSLNPIYEYFEKIWVKGYPCSVPLNKNYHYGIVLGSFSAWDQDRNRPEFGENADRLLEGIQLYHKKIIKKLIIASDGSILQLDNMEKYTGNPKAMREYLIRLGMSSDDLIFESKATTTHENATTIKKMFLETINNSDSVSFLLITSAVHMRRAILAFKKEGIIADPFVTDCIVDTKNEDGKWIPSLSVMRKWQTLLHEIIGYVVYKIRW